MSAGTTQVRVCQPTTTACVACMSPVLMLASDSFSSFSTMGTPAVGEYTRAEMVRLVAVSAMGPTLALAPAHTSPPRRMILPALPLPPAGPAAMAEVSAPLKPSKRGRLAPSNEASTTSPPTVGGITGRVSKACVRVLAPLLAMPPRSAKAPAATLTLIVPVLFFGGTTSSRYFVSLTLISATGAPPVTVMSLAVKLVPTDSLKVKTNVVRPSLAVAVAAVTLSSITSVGATPSGATGSLPPSPPPHAATSRDTASAGADRANFFERCFIEDFLTSIEANRTSDRVDVKTQPLVPAALS